MNGKQFPNEGLSLGIYYEMTSVIGNRKFFEASDIHYSNSRLQTTHDVYIKGYFRLLFDLNSDRGTSEGRTPQHENDSIRNELKFNEVVPEAITCLLYPEFDNSVPKDLARTVTTDF